jgi:4-hydroxymandelate oxidase
VKLFGEKFSSPIILCPLGAQKAFHPEGEIAVAKAAKARGHLQILSTVTSKPHRHRSPGISSNGSETSRR